MVETGYLTKIVRQNITTSKAAKDSGKIPNQWLVTDRFHYSSTVGNMLRLL